MVETTTCKLCPHEDRKANIIWTYGGDSIPVCWFHFHMLMMQVLGIGRDTAVGVTND